MRPISDALAEHFEVFNYDRRGRGDSGDTVPYSVEREIEDLRALIDEAGGRAHLYGHSSGAVLALRAAAAGVPVDRLVAHDPPFTPNPGGDPARVRYSTELERSLADAGRGDAVELFMGLTGMPAEVIAAMRESPAWPGFEAIAPTLSYDSQVMGDRDCGGAIPIAMLERLRVPLLVLAGGAVDDWMKRAGALVAEHVSDGRYEEIPGAGHAVQPEAYASMVVEFFAWHDAERDAAEAASPDFAA